jgi:hypothetical protein
VIGGWATIAAAIGAGRGWEFSAGWLVDNNVFGGAIPLRSLALRDFVLGRIQRALVRRECGRPLMDRRFLSDLAAALRLCPEARAFLSAPRIHRATFWASAGAILARDIAAHRGGAYLAERIFIRRCSPDGSACTWNIRDGAGGDPEGTTDFRPARFSAK